MQSLQQNSIDVQKILIGKLLLLEKETMKHILLYAQASMSESQFLAFRKLVMDAFGSRGLQQQINIAVKEVLERAGAKQG
jgi:hypothetical protein